LADVTSLAEKVEGRTIHITIDVWMVPPAVASQYLGNSDIAFEIGSGLIHEALLMLKNTGEAEGFTVEIKTRQVVY